MVQEKEVSPLSRLVHSDIFKPLLVSLVAITAVSIFLIARYADGSYAAAYFIGAALGTVNGLIGFYTIERFIDKSSLIFLKGISLGMGGRLLLLLGVFILLMVVFKTPVMPLVTGLIIFYFTMTIFEVIFLNRRIGYKKLTGTARNDSAI